MAQNGPHGHQVSASDDDSHSAPPTTVALFLTSAGGSSAGNMETVDASTGMGKNLIPDLNMEDGDSAGGSDDKPLSEAEVEVADTADDDDKGMVVAAADDGELIDNINSERERRKRMKGLFRTLQDLMPHVPEKTDKVTVVEEAIQYIKFLEEKAAIMGKQKLQQELARQAAAARGEASSSSLSLTTTAMPQTAQGMAALSSSDVPPGAGWGGVPVPPAAPAAVPAAPPVRFKTWSGRYFVLTVANDNAYISVWLPRRPNTLTMVTSVLHSHRIDVITAQISADSVRTLFMIYAHVNNRTDGENRSSVEVYQRAVSEIIYRLYGNYNNNNINSNN